jgi:hypothetical protein
MKSSAFAYFMPELSAHAYNTPILSFNIPIMMYIVRILSLKAVFHFKRNVPWRIKTNFKFQNVDWLVLP